MVQGKVTAISLNLRTAPNTDGSIIISLPKDTIVDILKTVAGEKHTGTSGVPRNDWHEVKVNGEQGFVAAGFIQILSTPKTITEIRGVWIVDHSHSKVLTSQSEIIEALDFLQGKGFNTVFSAVWNRGFTAFPSEVMERNGFPKQDPFYASKSFDPLAEIVTQAKSRNIAVIPWFEYGFAASPDDDGGHILRTKPQWSALNKTGGKVKHGTLTWMNSLDPEVQQFVLDLILEVIKKYNVDGIQGDDRLPALPFEGGYNTPIKNSFKAKFSKEPPADGKNAQWVQFRADLLTDFLERLFKEVKSTNPNMIVSISPSPFPFGLNNLMQDSDTWVKKNIVDFLHPQLYRESFDGGMVTIDGKTRSKSKYKTEVERIQTEFSTTQCQKFAPGIAFTANGINLSTTDIIQAVEFNRQKGLSGQVFFFYEGLRKNSEQMAIALQTKGGYDQIASLPSPFIV